MCVSPRRTPSPVVPGHLLQDFGHLGQAGILRTLASTNSRANRSLAVSSARRLERRIPSAEIRALLDPTGASTRLVERRRASRRCLHEHVQFPHLLCELDVGMPTDHDVLLDPREKPVGASPVMGVKSSSSLRGVAWQQRISPNPSTRSINCSGKEASKSRSARESCPAIQRIYWVPSPARQEALVSSAGSQAGHQKPPRLRDHCCREESGRVRPTGADVAGSAKTSDYRQHPSTTIRSGCTVLSSSSTAFSAGKLPWISYSAAIFMMRSFCCFNLCRE